MKSDVSYENSDLYKIRHSAAHVMAQAVVEKFPGAKVAIGPPIRNGFYYDFDLPRTLTPEDLEEIEGRMREIITGNHPFERKVVDPAEARALFADQPYKVELIDGILAGGVDEYGESIVSSDVTLTTYRQDTFRDLCRGPHVAHTGQIDPGAIKLLNVAGAYWRGDASRPMLQRIYGTAWPTKAELDDYLYKMEEAKKRDHRVLGKSLELFDTVDEVGSGLVLWHPKGALIRFLAERFSQDAHVMNGYEWVYTPHIGRENLWQTSGHLDFYKDSMYAPMDIDGEKYYLKPMNCPFHIHIYKSRPRSYRELPIRYAEFGSVYRYELSGVLHGLTRVRGFTQDDAHIFCRPEEAESEVLRALKFSLYVLRSFGLDTFKAYISTRPEEKSIGEDADWELATKSLVNAVEEEGLDYEYDHGGGAFYGPKIDLKVNDSLGREWQLSTVQFDFNLPERFDLEYIGSDGQAHRTFMVHRALFGSMERFFGLLIEHHGGAFPLWLAPVQVSLIPITDKQLDYAHEVADTLRKAGLRAEVNDAKDRMQAKIRTAEMDKIPFVFIIGRREVENGTISVRSYRDGDQGATTVTNFLESIASDLTQGQPTAL